MQKSPLMQIGQHPGADLGIHDLFQSRRAAVAGFQLVPDHRQRLLQVLFPGARQWKLFLDVR